METERIAQRFLRAEEGRQTRVVGDTWKRWEKDGDHIIGVYLKTTIIHGREDGRQRTIHTFWTDDGYVSAEIYGKAGGSFTRCATVGRIYGIKYHGKEEYAEGKTADSFVIKEVVD